MLSVVDAGFELSREQRQTYTNIQDWLHSSYQPQLEKLICDIKEARDENRRLSNNQWRLESALYEARKQL
jgi:hypothetical protein